MKLKEFTNEDYLSNLDKLFEAIQNLDSLYNQDFVTITQYCEIKNRIIDEICYLRQYEKKVLEGDSNDR